MSATKGAFLVSREFSLEMVDLWTVDVRVWLADLVGQEFPNHPFFVPADRSAWDAICHKLAADALDVAEIERRQRWPMTVSRSVEMWRATIKTFAGSHKSSIFPGGCVRVEMCITPRP